MNNDSASTRRGSILIVDDIPDSLTLLHRLLSQEGFEVVVANSGEKALSLVRDISPEIVLLDVCMPQMSGYEVCRSLKADPLTQPIPVIFMSALDEILDKVRAFQLGGVDYMTKPLQIAEVVARLDNHLTLRRVQQQLEAQNAHLRQEVQNHVTTEAALQSANQELQRLAHLDELTQVANRRRFDVSFEQEWRRLTREQRPLSLILCDVDFFKIYNDTYGHQAGDECLRQIANAISTALRRPSDLVARYGGEEFAIILPNTPIRGAIYIAREIQAAILALQLPHSGSRVCAWVTLSLGIASVLPSPNLSPMFMIAAADRALYRAKADGRNRIRIEDIYD